MVLYTGSGTVKVHNCGLGPHADMIFVKKITHKNLVEIYPLGYNYIAFRIVFQGIYASEKNLRNRRSHFSCQISTLPFPT